MNKYKYVDSNVVVLSRLYIVVFCNDDRRGTDKVLLRLLTLFC